MKSRFVQAHHNYYSISFSEGSIMSDTNKKESLLEAPIKVKGENEETMKEFNLSWAGKIFFAGAAAYILGRAMKQTLPIKIKGTPEQLRAITDAIISSKIFQKEINRPGASIDSVIEKLQLRNMSKEQFRRITNKQWPL
jgi:hypothetical protein